MLRQERCIAHGASGGRKGTHMPEATTKKGERGERRGGSRGEGKEESGLSVKLFWASTMALGLHHSTAQRRNNLALRMASAGDCFAMLTPWLPSGCSDI
eukprot:3430514-Rhodomonas_salina.1